MLPGWLAAAVAVAGCGCLAGCGLPGCLAGCMVAGLLACWLLAACLMIYSLMGVWQAWVVEWVIALVKWYCWLHLLTYPMAGQLACLCR